MAPETPSHKARRPPTAKRPPSGADAAEARVVEAAEEAELERGARRARGKA